MTFAPPERREHSATRPSATAGIAGGCSLLPSKTGIVSSRRSENSAHAVYCQGRLTMNQLTKHSKSVDSDGHTAPLDEVTVLSLTEIEQSVTTCDAFSDVSSLSSADEYNEERESVKAVHQVQDSPRSIFTSYWSRTCPIDLKRLPLPLIVLTEDLVNIQQGTNEADSVNTYERVLRDHEQSRPPLPVLPQQQRLHRGLGNCLSLPQLARAAQPAPLSSTRLNLSTSVLESRRRTAPPCLRPRRTASDGERQQEVSSSQTVRFSDTVEIMEFTPPAAMWAPKGWSDYFY
jgi:hypothetical protein